jgi:hypothetical protein
VEPREPGRARTHGPGESLTTNGDGSGVMSVNAFKAGEESADPGERELVILAVDSAVLRFPPCMAIGAVAENRRCPSALLSTIVGVFGDSRGAVVAYRGRSVWSCRPAAEGVRM